MTHDPDDPRYTTVHGGVQMPNTHDPMCPWGKVSEPIIGCACDLIARVRADERERAAERVAALLSFPALPYGRHRIDKAAAVAAARGGE